MGLAQCLVINSGVTSCAGGQVQYSLLDRRAENFMGPFCAERGIALLPYGTTAGGLLSERYLGLPASRCARGCAEGHLEIDLVVCTTATHAFLRARLGGAVCSTL